MRRILVFTNEPVLAEGLRNVLQADGVDSISVCNQSPNLGRAVQLWKPDLLLLHLTSLERLETIAELRRSYPWCKLVLLAEKLGLPTVSQVLDSGVDGILSTSLSLDALSEALAKISRGELQFHFEANSAKSSGRTRVHLARREQELISLICAGLKNKEIATAMNLTEGSVKAYLNRIYRRVGAMDRFELALYGLADRHGFAPPPAADQKLTNRRTRNRLRHRGPISCGVERTVVASA